MSTYFLSLNVSPTQDNAQYAVVRGALAHCWIVEDNPEDAFSKASFYVAKYDWSVEDIETYPIETTRQDFAQRDLGLENFDKAQRHGIAVVFLGWARDGKTTFGPTELEPLHTIDINGFLKTLKYFKNRGRCLHFDSNGRCQEIVHAHSIQRGKALSPISCDGHVYRLTPVIGNPENSMDRLSCERVGVNRVSTFLGFCKRHDSQLFAEIDKHSLIPTDKQVFLYAYRSLCRELFVKENSLNILESQLNKGPIQKAIRDLLSDIRRGTAFGLKNLKKHKLIYDDSLRERRYSDIEYVLFESNQNPSMAFSGLFYPDFDFLGRRLQDLGDYETELELITICSALTESGWGFLFSWHASSSKVCNDFMRSLATMVHDGCGLGDLLFRLVISNCENHAISPQWWENLPSYLKEQIIHRASKMVDVLSNTPRSYLMEGLEGIVNWRFDNVISTMRESPNN